ncbi:hypothetical protein LCGC14_1931250 [marine sediment metagenome]|uniref:BED-type domain-containing protein n=1 Tax=marine sediment metagenome TaxID=412755 RepID=A0A0F9FMZ8_9ZZZZ
MSQGKEIVAYKAWKCKFCPEVRQESTDMWRHLQDEHGIGSVENNSKVMVSLDKKKSV